MTPKPSAKIRQNTKKLTATSVSLVWAKVPQATGYFVYRRKADGKFHYIARVTTNRYTDKHLSDAKQFTYLVKAFADTPNGTVTGEGSHAVTVVTRPAQVKSLKVKAAKGKLTLSWQNNKHADSYLIYQANKENGKYQKVAETKAAHLSLNLKSGSTAYFKVRAVKAFNGKRVASAISKAVKGVAG